MEKVQIVDSKKSKETKESRKVDVPSDVMAELTFRCTKHMTVRGIGRSGLASHIKKVYSTGCSTLQSLTKYTIFNRKLSGSCIKTCVTKECDA